MTKHTAESVVRHIKSNAKRLIFKPESFIKKAFVDKQNAHAGFGIR